MRTHWKRLLLQAALASSLLAPVGLTACAHSSSAAPAASKTAPDFTLPTADGAELSLAAQRGTVVVLNFWASWCEPCLEELPLLDALHAKISAEGATVIGVNIDAQRAPAAGVVASLDLKLPVLFDSGSTVVAQYDPPTMPTTYLIDVDGVIVETISGMLTADAIDRLEDRVRQLLSPSSSGS